MAKKKAHPQERAFLDDVSEHGGDDVPRLVSADWLDESGRSRRAEFIRLQCRLLAAADQRSLRRLEIEGHAASVSDLRELARNPRLAGLEHLDLSAGPITAEHVLALTHRGRCRA